MLTSAKLPSIAFLRKSSLGLSFADALAIKIAIRVAVPSDKRYPTDGVLPLETFIPETTSRAEEVPIGLMACSGHLNFFSEGRFERSLTVA